MFLCTDVLVAAANLLQYPVPFKFVPFGDGSQNPSYPELINNIIINVSFISYIYTIHS